MVIRVTLPLKRDKLCKFFFLLHRVPIAIGTQSDTENRSIYREELRKVKVFNIISSLKVSDFFYCIFGPLVTDRLNESEIFKSSRNFIKKNIEFDSSGSRCHTNHITRFQNG